jgi:hypothetical protein
VQNGLAEVQIHKLKKRIFATSTFNFLDLTLNFFLLFLANSTRKAPNKKLNNSHGKKSNVEKFEVPK